MVIETTGIGSLPFPYVDQALMHSMEYTIPFFPQLPMRDPREFALPQALDGFPGASLKAGGLVTIDEGSAEAVTKELLPSPQSAAAFRAFLLELEERKPKRAKLQLAGPITLLWATNVGAKTGAEVTKFLIARAHAMLSAVKERGVEPILFFDEPALFSIRSAAELAPLAQARRDLKDFQIGLHCCSNTRWADVLALGFDVLSIDSALSLPDVLEAYKGAKHKPVLSLGVIPTNRMGTHFFPAEQGQAWAQQTAQSIVAEFKKHDLSQPAALWLTPACGLGLQNVQNAQATRELLELVSKAIQN